jgi:hypothetical protein
VRAALLAPSGDNCQPWSFSWDGKVLCIFHSEFRGRHALNPANHASLISLGAVLECMRIAASSDGYAVESTINWENVGTESAWAEVRFAAAVTVADKLAEWLDRRCTDRRRYRGGQLDAPCLRAIAAENEKNKQVAVRVAPLTPALIEFIAGCEGYVWSHPAPHRDLMRWIRFNRKEAELSRDGMHWRNLAVRWWQSRVLYLISHWRRQRWVNRMGFLAERQRLVREELKSSAGVLVFSAPGREVARLPEVGRLALRTWLQLNAGGYGVQPLTLASLTVYDAAQGLLTPEVTPEFRTHFEKGEAILRRELGLGPTERPIWMLRFGLSSPLPPGARTLRREIDSVLSWLPAAR